MAPESGVGAAACAASDDPISSNAVGMSFTARGRNEW
jgi:hypothetical protein